MNFLTKILISFAILTLNSVNAQQVSIPDVEFELALLNQGVDTGTLDGLISLVDAESFTGVLDISTSGSGSMATPIKNLTGIEAFVNITGLDSSPTGAEIHTMDLSFNTELTYINLMSSILMSDLDFSNNSKLLDLRVSSISPSNAFTNINLSNLGVLQRLELSYGAIASLDLSYCNSLTEIYVSLSSNLTSIDFALNTLLNTIYINECTSLGALTNMPNISSLTASNCNLSTLNISAHTNLTHINLTNNNLDFLNINNGTNTSITNFNISNNSNLICVVVDDVSYSNTNWVNKDVHTVYNEQSCDLVAIPDAEFEKRLISIGVDTTGILDGYILKYDAEAVTGVLNTSIEVDGILTDYTGIEAFINITGFVVVNISDRVTTLDLSNNTLLEEIEIAYITDFPDFDFRANTNLKILKINADGWQSVNSFNINGLTQLEELEIIKSSFNNLDLSTNTALNKLNIEFSNNLSALDLSSHTLLNRLYVQECNNLASININNGTNTSITNFNISNNSNLICVVVDDVSYSNTNWVNKDVHTVYNEQSCDLVAIPDVEFEKRLISIGVDTTGILDGYILKSDAEAVTSTLSLNTSVDDGLQNLTGIEAFINITGLSIHSSIGVTDAISIMDLSYCTELTEIYLDGVTNMVDFDLSSNTKLEELEITGNQTLISSLNVIGLNTLRYFGFDNYDDISIDISTNSSLEILEVFNAPNIVSLDLSTCPAITELSLDSLASIQNLNLISLNQLRYLELYNTGVGFTHLDLSSSSASLTSLNLSQNNLLAITLDDLSQLEELSIQDNLLLGNSINLTSAISLINLNIENTGVKSINIVNGVNTNITGVNFNITNNLNLTCVQVDDATYSNTNWINKDVHTVYSESVCNTLWLNVKVFLQGAALNPIIGEEGLMRDDLRSGVHLPIISPYKDELIVDPLIFNAGGESGTSGPNDDIVDWVWVELRNEIDPTIVMASQSAFIQRDGNIVNSLGWYYNLAIEQPDGNYFIVIKHRNHLGIMTANPIALSGATSLIDFTDANNQITYGANAQTTLGMPNGVVAMWAGNVGGDSSVKYTGAGNDATGIKDEVLSDLGNATSSNLYSFNGYNIADVNLDGTTKYSGSGNDSTILKDIILAHPDNQAIPSNLFEILEQLPEN